MRGLSWRIQIPWIPKFQDRGPSSFLPATCHRDDHRSTNLLVRSLIFFRDPMDLDKWHGVDFPQLEEDIYKTIEKLVEPRQPRWSRLEHY